MELLEFFYVCFIFETRFCFVFSGVLKLPTNLSQPLECLHRWQELFNEIVHVIACLSQIRCISRYNLKENLAVWCHYQHNNLTYHILTLKRNLCQFPFFLSCPPLVPRIYLPTICLNKVGVVCIYK